MAALRLSPLRRILIAQAPADFSDWLDFVAVGALLAFTWEAEPFVFALLAVALGLPYIVVGPLAGVFVDRTSLRLVLIGSNLGRAAVTASLALAGTWPVLLALVFLRSCVDATFTPAKQAAIQATTRPEERMSANGISHAINQASKVIAPALGGALLIGLEPSEIFLLNAGVSLVAVALLVGLAPIDRTQTEPPGRILDAIRDGWTEAMAKPRLRGALGLMAAGYFAMFFYDTLIAPLIRDLGFDAATLGLALAAVGAGGVIASVILARSSSGRPFLLIGVGSTIGALCVAALGSVEIIGGNLPLLGLLGLFFVLGVVSVMSVVPVWTVLQTETHPARMARVTALSEAANTAALLIAPFLGAALAAALSIGAAFVAGAIVMAGLALAALRLHQRET